MLKKIFFICILTAAHLNMCGQNINYAWETICDWVNRLKNHQVNKGKVQAADAALAVANQSLELAKQAAPALAANAAAQQLDLAATTQAVEQVNATAQAGFQKILEQFAISRKIQEDIDAKMALAAVVVDAIVIYKAVSGIKCWIFLSAEQKAAKLKAQQELKFQEFNTCLLKNENGKKDENGLPCACQQVMQEFLEVTGHHQLHKVQKSFKEAHKQA